MKKCIYHSALALAAATTTPMTAMSQDATDSFFEVVHQANAQYGFSFLGSNDGATDDRSALEANPYNSVLTDNSIYGRSGVWLRWGNEMAGDPVLVNQPIYLEITSADFDTTLAVFEYRLPDEDPVTVHMNNFANVVENLDVVATNDDISSSNRNSRVRFTAREGYDYWILVGGFNGAQGNFSLQTRPVNDDQATPFRLVADSIVNVDDGGGEFTAPEVVQLPSDRAVRVTERGQTISTVNSDGTTFLRIRPPGVEWLHGVIIDPEDDQPASQGNFVSPERAFLVERNTNTLEETLVPLYPDRDPSAGVTLSIDEDQPVDICDSAFFDEESGESSFDFCISTGFDSEAPDFSVPSGVYEFEISVTTDEDVDYYRVYGVTFNLIDARVDPAQATFRVDDDGDIIRTDAGDFTFADDGSFSVELLLDSDNDNILEAAQVIVGDNSVQEASDWLNFTTPSEQLVGEDSSFGFEIDGDALAQLPEAEREVILVFRGYANDEAVIDASCVDTDNADKCINIGGLNYIDSNPTEVERRVLVRAYGPGGPRADGFSVTDDDFDVTGTVGGSFNGTKSFTLSADNDEGVVNIEVVRDDPKPWLTFATDVCASSQSCSFQLSEDKTVTFTLGIDASYVPTPSGNEESAFDSEIIVLQRTDTDLEDEQVLVVATITVNAEETVLINPPTSSGGGGGGCAIGLSDRQDPTLAVLAVLAACGLVWRRRRFVISAMGAHRS